MYSTVTWWRFALAVGVVSAPAILLDEGSEGRLAYSYAALLLLVFALSQQEGIVTFLNFLTSELEKG